MGCGSGDRVVWHVPESGSLVWEEWESEYTVYDRATGETHLLSLLPAEIIRLLDQGPLSLEVLSREMASLCEVERTPEWDEQMRRVLQDLASLSLVGKQVA